MECACVYVDLASDIYPDWWFDFGGFIPAKREVDCSECGAVIAPGELHEKFDVLWASYRHPLTAEKAYRSYRTCRDCHSIRTAFFCEGWFWTRIHEDLWKHIVDVDGELSEQHISELTPGARAVVCGMLEEMWRMDEGVMVEDFA